MREFFDAAARELASRHPEVEDTRGGRSRAFGAETLKVHGKIFAMLQGGRLVVKLPRQRVDELIDTGFGGRFESAQGRPMKEWVTLSPADQPTCLAYMDEAVTYVSSQVSRG